jgi:hypothetical protein
MMTETERKFTVADYILRNLFDSIDAILHEIDRDTNGFVFEEIRERLDNTEREIGEEMKALIKMDKIINEGRKNK